MLYLLYVCPLSTNFLLGIAALLSLAHKKDASRKCSANNTCREIKLFSCGRAKLSMWHRIQEVMVIESVSFSAQRAYFVGWLGRKGNNRAINHRR